MMIRRPPRWAVAWILLALLLTALPYIAASLSAPPGTHFSGVLQNPIDTNSYLAYMERGAQGEWQHIMPYNWEENKPIPIYAVYIIPGQFGRWLPIPVIFHLLRLIYGAIFGYACYCFAARWLATEREQKLALFIMLFGGGIGWLTILLYHSPDGYPPNLVADIWGAEAIGFSTLLGFPHFALSIALFIWMLLSGYDFIHSRAWRSGIQGMIAGALLAVTHTHHLLTVGVVLGLLMLPLDGRRLLRFTVLFIPAGLLTLYLLITIQHDPYLRAWSEVGNPLNVPIYSQVITYGLTLILAIIGTGYAYRQRITPLYMSGLWFISVFVFMYLPWDFQRRFIEGWQVPLAVLAAAGWYRVCLPAIQTRLGYKFTRRATGLVFALLGFGTLFIFVNALVRIGDKANPHYYITADEQGALDWLDDHADKTQVVLAEYENGNRLPARVDVLVYSGHVFVTREVKQKNADIHHFFDAATSDHERIALLRDHSIDYVYYADAERSLGGFMPEAAPYLREVYSSASVQIYAVELEANY